MTKKEEDDLTGIWLLVCLVVIVISFIVGMYMGHGDKRQACEEATAWEICTQHDMTFVGWSEEYRGVINCGEEVKVCEVNGKLKNCRQEIKQHKYKFSTGRPW